MKSSQSPEETNTNTAGTPQASAANDDIAIILPDEGIVVEHQRAEPCKRNGHYAKGPVKKLKRWPRGDEKHACLEMRGVSHRSDHAILVSTGTTIFLRVVKMLCFLEATIPSPTQSTMQRRSTKSICSRLCEAFQTPFPIRNEQ
jgi:hypothetical protein